MKKDRGTTKRYTVQTKWLQKDRKQPKMHKEQQESSSMHPQ